MPHKAILTLCTLMCVVLTAQASSIVVLDNDTTTQTEKTTQPFKSKKQKAEELKRQRIKNTLSGVKLADKLAEGGIDFNPFTKEYVAGRYSPFDSTVLRRDSLNMHILYRNDQQARRFWIGAFTGVNDFVHTSATHLKPAMTMGVMGGYNFNGLHAVRLTANFTRYIGEDFAESVKSIQIGADYMLNLSNYLYGENPRRRFEIKPAFGFGVIGSFSSGREQWSPTMRLGANLAYHVTRGSEFFVEPFVMLAKDGADLLSSPRKYDVQYGLWAGLRADFSDSDNEQTMRMPSFNPNIYVDLSLGYEWYKMSGWRSTAKRSIGTNYQVAIGRWLNPVLGFRIGLSGGDFYWDGQPIQAQHSGANTQTHSGGARFHRGLSFTGRVELMARPLNFIRLWRELDYPVDLELGGGIEAGYYVKSAVKNYGNLSTFNLGYTVNGALLYRLAPGASIFVQPRVQFVNFNVPNADYGKEGSYTEYLFTINAGVRLQAPTRKQRIEMYESPFRPHFEVGAYGGGLKYVGEGTKLQTHYPLNGAAGLYTAFHISRIHSIVAEAEYMRLNQQYYAPYTVKVGDVTIKNRGYMTHELNLVEAKLMYGLNVTNLLMKANYMRRHFNVYGLIGPSYITTMHSPIYLNPGEMRGGDGPITYSIQNLDGNYSMGLVAGFRVTYDFTKHFGIFAQPEGEALFSAYKVTGSPHQYGFIAKMQAGVKYNF